MDWQALQTAVYRDLGTIITAVAAIFVVVLNLMMALLAGRDLKIMNEKIKNVAQISEILDKHLTDAMSMIRESMLR